MNPRHENWAALQMLHLSVLTWFYCRDRNGQKLENNNYTLQFRTLIYIYNEFGQKPQAKIIMGNFVNNS